MMVLNFAAYWICPRCGEKNYTDLIPHEFSYEERRQLMDRGIDPNSNFWSMLPPYDECSCGNVYFLRGQNGNE